MGLRVRGIGAVQPSFVREVTFDRAADWTGAVPMAEIAGDRDARLAQRFVALADTMVADFDIADLLDQLVHAVVEFLPVEEAGLLLLDDSLNPQLLASTSESTRLLELFQIQGLGGPCVECARTGAAVTIEDLAQERRWPSFCQMARQLGFEGVHALPLRLRGEVLGALNLFGRHGEIGPADLAVGQSLADLATIGILQQRSQHQAAVETRQLQQALRSRVVIEQAKGLLSEFGGVEMTSAFAALRGYARHHNLKLAAVAQAVVDRAMDPSEIVPPRPPRA